MCGNKYEVIRIPILKKSKYMLMYLEATDLTIWTGFMMVHMFLGENGFQVSEIGSYIGYQQLEVYNHIE